MGKHNKFDAKYADSPWTEWKREQEAKHSPPLPAPCKIQTRPELIKRTITLKELDKVKKLQKVSTAWWCQDGRFIEQFKDATSDVLITERQAWFIEFLWYKYRRQLGHNDPKPAGA